MTTRHTPPPVDDRQARREQRDLLREQDVQLDALRAENANLQQQMQAQVGVPAAPIPALAPVQAMPTEGRRFPDIPFFWHLW